MISSVVFTCDSGGEASASIWLIMWPGNCYPGDQMDTPLHKEHNSRAQYSRYRSTNVHHRADEQYNGKVNCSAAVY